jgi:hypothetical protein
MLGTDGPRPRGPSARWTRIGDKGPTSGLVPSKPPAHRREVSSRDVGGGRIPTPAASVADQRRAIQSSRWRDVRKLSTTKSATSLPSR